MKYCTTPSYAPDYVAHYGVLGMKWGVRRYQNYDGTLTAAGKAQKAQNEANWGSRSYRAGAKRLTNRVNRLDKKAAKLSASWSHDKREKGRSYQHDADDAANMLKSPQMVKKVGKITLAGRISGASAAAGATVVAGILAGPAGALPVGAVSGALYGRSYYRSTR